MTDYQGFLESKIALARAGEAESAGINAELHASLKPHQVDMARWMLSQGRGLLAASFGLGKTRVQTAVAQVLHRETDRPFLGVCPLGVRHQFTEEDGPAMEVRWQYVRTDDEVRAADSPYLITNYERIRDGNIDPRKHELAGVSLDEGSVLRTLGSKTYQTFTDLFAHVQHRYVCTATPAPNRYKELLHYAAFLGVMDVGQALTRWFKRDPQQAGNLQLHPHHEKEFWLWVASWALFLYAPSDLGHSDEGYALPPLNMHWHRITVDHTRAWSESDNRGQGKMFLDAANSVGTAAREKRATLPARIEKAWEIVNAQSNDTHWLIWHHLEDERRAITSSFPDAVAVYGSQDLEEREQAVIDFSHGKIRVLATKPELSGSGCNFQYHCHSNVFLGIDYRFEDFIQSIHRTYRFQQKHPVDVHVIYAESEDGIVETLKQKWRRHDELTTVMRSVGQSYGLSQSAMRRDLQRQIGVQRVEVKGRLFTAVNNDCVAELRNIPDNSVGLIHTSIPFGKHYEYTAQYEDFGHSPTDDNFWRQMDYLIPQLLRVTKPGRVAAVHVKDRVLYGHQTASGIMETAPFSDDCVRAFRAHGWTYQGRRTIVTDVVRENAGTYRLGFSEMCRDASKMSSGLPEYVLLFRKPPTLRDTARADEPVTKEKREWLKDEERWSNDDGYTRGRWQITANGFWRSSGNVLVWSEPYDHEAHVARLDAIDARGELPSGYAVDAPKSHSEYVWDEIMPMRCLNSEQSNRRQQVHICPLPFDIVERVIKLYSNPGDVVLDPFSGLFTVPYVAIKLGRYGHGIELSTRYFQEGVRYCEDIEREVSAPTLFDFVRESVTVQNGAAE